MNLEKNLIQNESDEHTHAQQDMHMKTKKDFDKLFSLKARNLSEMTAVKHGFYGRRGGVSEGVYSALNCNLSSIDKVENIVENRRRVAMDLGAQPENLLSCYQIHSPDVVVVEKTWQPQDRPRADALVTVQKNIAIGVLTADCTPVLFCEPEAGVIGAAHAGWRGAVGGVLENTVKAMVALGAEREKIRAAIGPCIHQKSYEVGPEFPAPFLAEHESNAEFFRTSANQRHYMFDLAGYVYAKLKKSGLMDIEASPADTCAEQENFFSYRRNCLAGLEKVGGEVSVIMLV